MKSIKIVLVACGLLTAMAVGADSVSANAKLCTFDAGIGTSCGPGHGNIYEGLIKTSLVKETTSKFVGSNGGTVSCAQSTGEAKVTNGEIGTGTVNLLTFNSCTSTTTCGGATTAETNANTSTWSTTATTAIPDVFDTNGYLDITGADITMTFKCIGITVCIYKASAPLIHIIGSKKFGETAVLKAENVSFTRTTGSESQCGNTGTWNATYTSTSPDTLLVT